MSLYRYTISFSGELEADDVEQATDAVHATLDVGPFAPIPILEVEEVKP